MLDYLNSCESLEVDINELEYFVLAPGEPDVDEKHIALHAKGERREREACRTGGFTCTASRSRAFEVEAGSPSLEVEGQEKDLPSPKNQLLEELVKGWWNAEMEGGRGTLAFKGGFTSTATGTQIPDMKADCWSAASATVF